MTEKAENLRKTLLMNVWDKEAHEKHERAIIHIYPDQTCVDCDGNTWNYCEEIPVKNWRPFAPKESLDHLKDCWFRRKGSLILVKPTSFNPLGKDVFMLNTYWYSKIFLFAYYEVFNNNEWQPVGIFN